MLPSRVVCIALSCVRQRLISRPKRRGAVPGRPGDVEGPGHPFTAPPIDHLATVPVDWVRPKDLIPPNRMGLPFRMARNRTPSEETCDDIRRT
jgi:hypothetical protein